MTRDDLVRRLRDEADTLTALARRFDDTGDEDAAALEREKVVGLETRIAALAAPPAAPPVDLVALVDDAGRELALLTAMQDQSHERVTMSVETLQSLRLLLMRVVAAAPRVPDTPQGWPDANNAVRWESREPQCVIGVYCQRHGFIHGQEAEELRERLEALSLPAVNRVLDAVDARDSLAYLEATNEPTPPDADSPQEPPR